jgi:hypothetical protein
MLKVIYGQIGAGYLFDTSFQSAYLERGVDCYVDLMYKVPSASQMKKDTCALYGALVQNAQNIGMVDTVFEALVDDKSFLETCNFLRSHATRHDQQKKEKNARQINNTSQSSGTTKKDKIKTVLALINELQVQDSIGSDELIDAVPCSKTALVCKLAQIPP